MTQAEARSLFGKNGQPGNELRVVRLRHAVASHHPLCPHIVAVETNRSKLATP
jgi:hypothetical protein